MPLPDQTPRLPKWPFLTGDAALLGAAWLIFDNSGRPLPVEAIVGIAGCCVCAVFAGAIPFLADYARKQDEALDERQRSLESLARTISTAAEQISIAAAGFQEITEIAQKNIRHAEQLPQKLHEKISEFQARLAQAADEEKEELERELAALRSSESERLESITDKIARAAADWAKVESAAARQLSATQAVLAQFEENVSRFERRAGQYEGRIARTSAESDPAVAGFPILAAQGPPPRSDEAGPAPEPVSAVPAVEPAPAKGPEAPVAAATADKRDPPAKPERKRAPKKPAEAKAPAAVPPAASPPPVESEPPAGEEPPAPVRSGKAREKRPEPGSADSLALEFSQVSPDDGAPSVAVSADGATRLLVTAYIGIGNRLFIRGEGPGLSWDKGVPLQFVSIGKWRWETTEATVPVKFKLYRNDETEFNGLNPPSLEPGRQMEMTATI
ncbi:MAG: hypothetical protein ABSA05_09275 [Opitutaceae bacterium]|jgi:hypothetical protein